MPNMIRATCLAAVCLLSISNAQAQTNTPLEADWLFQCDNAPTFAKTKQEIAWARALSGRIGALKGAPDLSAPLAALAELEKQLGANPENPDRAKSLYLAVRAVKRDLTFKNPLIDFDKIVLIDNPYPKGKPGDATDEWGHEARHRNGFMAVDGGRLMIVGLNPDSAVTDVLKGRTGSFWRPDVAFNGQKFQIRVRKGGSAIPPATNTRFFP